MDDLILPDWPAPPCVKAVSTTRRGGLSKAPYDHFNLALHVGDDPDAVHANRKLLKQSLKLPAEPLWLNQIHSNQVIHSDQKGSCNDADAMIGLQPGTVCVVMTADCLPLLICDRSGSKVSAVHAGWRGLLAGIIERAIAALAIEPKELIAWLGPAIGPDAFEVDEPVISSFTNLDPAYEQAFSVNRPGHWLMDIYALAEMKLRRSGVQRISGGELCTASDASRFYSYRRDGRTGRMASLIWIDK